MAQVKVVRTDAEIECPHLDAGLRERGLALVLVSDGIPEAALVREVQEAEILLMCYTPVTARVIEATQRLRGIVKYGVGIDAIDIAAAKARRIPVVNVPEYAERTVAEGAFALLLALAKRLAPMHVAMRESGWVWPSAPWLGSDIAGKTIGLVGVGRIGRSMAQMAGAGFQARVLGYDPHVSSEQMRAAGVDKRADLHAMLAECDFVSIHCVLDESTRGLIGARELAHMKPGAILINVSRGAIVDETALVRALIEGRLGGAGLDVYTNEPLNRTDHPLRALFEMDNVILTPHLTFFTREAMQRLEAEVLLRCDELLRGEPVLVKSRDPRLTSQVHGVRFA
ncbi:MAG TPA: NAD(P)-dependent oxidoreductase [Burkholderiaceae bacterium]|nr:NAD(P)-dependent oxidoreductase [Burkholderiaceae bacterium]